MPINPTKYLSALLYCAALSYLDTPLKAAKVAKEKQSFLFRPSFAAFARSTVIKGLTAKASLLPPPSLQGHRTGCRTGNGGKLSSS